LRKGTWLVIIGLILLSVSIVLIAVFWRWWYGPEINYPMRIFGITMLVVGALCFILGVISNLMMVNDPISKSFIGSPPRPTSWILFGSIISLIIASDAITIYYTYWHNRFVNTPLIVIAIVFYFFGGITFIVCVIRNFRYMEGERYKAKHGEIEYIKKYKRKLHKKKIAEEKKYKSEIDIKPSDISSTDIQKNKTPLMLENLNELNETVESGYSDFGTKKKDFRKKNVRLAPRTATTSYLFQNNQSVNYDVSNN
jgi:hypothetical protein